MPEIRAYTTSAAHATLKSAISKRPWKNFEKAQKLDPSNLTIQFNLAEAHYVNHDYSRALKAFTELLLPFKDNPGMTPLLQFKRYICARKLDNQPLAAELEKLYGPMDDTPYYYCTQAILKLMEGGQGSRPGTAPFRHPHLRRHQRHPGLHGRHDGGWHPSLPHGQTVPTEQPVKTGLEKRR